MKGMYFERVDHTRALPRLTRVIAQVIDWKRKWRQH
jgi:hypothetical protein